MNNQVELLHQRIAHRQATLCAATMVVAKQPTTVASPPSSCTPSSSIVMATVGSDSFCNVFAPVDDSPALQFAPAKESNSINVNSTCIAFDHSLSLVLVGCANGTARLFSRVNGSLMMTVDAGRSAEPDSVVCLDFYPYGEIFATGTASGKVRLWDSTDPSVPMNSYRAPNDGAATVIRFTPGGEWLIVGHASGAIVLWGLTDRSRALAPAPIKLHSSAISAISFHHSDALIAIADAGGSVRLFEFTESSGTFTSVGSAVDCQCSPIKALCFVGSSTLVATADANVVAMQFTETALTVANRIGAKALTGVLAAVADGSEHVIVCSQTQRAGGVCVWRIDLQATSNSVTPVKQATAASTPTVSNENTPTNIRVVTPAVAPVIAPAVASNTPTFTVVAPAPKQNSARAKTAAMSRNSSSLTPPVVTSTRTPPVVAAKAPPVAAAPAAAAVPAAPVISEERRVLEELLSGHKPIHAMLQTRTRKFEAAVLVLQQTGARLADALKALQSSDVGQAVTVAEQLSKRAQECSDRFEYGPALTLADAAAVLCGDVLTSWNLEVSQICTTLSLVAQLAKWCDISAGPEHDAMAASCRTRMSAILRLLQNENTLSFQLTTQSRALRHECLKFEKYY